VFAAEGYRKATIEQICRRAGANIAAVNYHFGDKEKLYAEVFAYADRCATEAHPVDLLQPRGGAPEQRLQRQIEALIGRLFDRGRPAWHARLMAQEMVEPTAVLDRRVNDRIRATYDQLAAIVRELIGSQVSDDTVRLCAVSILGQCVFYRHSAPIITRLHPTFDAADEAPRLAAHVTRFSLEAIRGLRSSAQKGRRS
jgi:AcrR family transcriptional regulator